MEVVGPGDGAGDEGEDFAAVFVQAEGAGRAGEADGVEVVEQGVHGWCPWSGGSAHGVADADDTDVHVSAFQRYFVVGHWGLLLPGLVLFRRMFGGGLGHIATHRATRRLCVRASRNACSIDA